MPIRFDDAAATELAAQLEITARSLLEVVDRFEREVVAATEEWRGRFRHTFDVESARHDLEARALANDLHLMAVAVRAKMFEAQAARQAEALVLEQLRQAALDQARRDAAFPPPGAVPVAGRAPR